VKTDGSGQASTLIAEGDQAANVVTEQSASPAFLTWFLVAFAIAFGLVWVYVAVLPMAFLSRDYPLWIAKRTMLDECRLGSVAVFGDSRTLAATVPDAMPVPVTNFAMSGTSPIETYFAVRRALRCPTPPKLVVIAHGALKFASDSDYWNFSARTGFLDYSDMRAVDADAARLGDGEIGALRRGDQLSPGLRGALFAIRFPAFYFDSLVNSFVMARWQHNLTAMHEALLSSGHALFGTAPGSSEVAGDGLATAYATSPLIDLYFSRTVRLLAQRGVPVVVLSMPVNQATYVRMQPAVRQAFTAYLLEKAREFPNLRVVGPTAPCWPDRFFGDAWHFNADGAAEFSAVLGVWLRDVLAGRGVAELPDRCAVVG
jgi:hypothetical protein